MVIKTNLLQPGVLLEGDRGVEALPVLEHLQRQRDLHGLPLLLDAEQRPLQVEPEADLLQRGAVGGVTVQLGHLLDLPHPLGHQVL